jgi:hypothetical protein
VVYVDSSDRAWLKKQYDELKTSEDPVEGIDLNLNTKAATMSDIDSYIEGLYEEMNEKITSTQMILQLAKNPANMSALVSNGIC